MVKVDFDYVMDQMQLKFYLVVKKYTDINMINRNRTSCFRKGGCIENIMVGI